MDDYLSMLRLTPDSYFCTTELKKIGIMSDETIVPCLFLVNLMFVPTFFSPKH